MAGLRRVAVLWALLGVLPARAFSDDEQGVAPVAPMSEAPPDAAGPSAVPQAAPPSQTPPGQWVYTNQYGWIWMPYSDAYTYSPPDGDGEPYMYVYYPAYGWSWVVAPWVWGWGPWPFFGVAGPWHFGWYGHGWWRSPWRWHYAGGGYGFRPYATGFGVRGGPHTGGFVGGGVTPRVGGGVHSGGHR